MAGKVLRNSRGQFNGSTRGWGAGSKVRSSKTLTTPKYGVPGRRMVRPVVTAQKTTIDRTMSASAGARIVNNAWGSGPGAVRLVRGTAVRGYDVHRTSATSKPTLSAIRGQGRNSVRPVAGNRIRTRNTARLISANSWLR